MNYVCIGICAVLDLYAIVNKIVWEKKYGKMKKIGHCVHLPESFFWFGLLGNIYFSAMVYWYIPFYNKYASPWGADLAFLGFCLMGVSIAFAQANSRIYYDEEHIYYSTFFGRRYEFQYDEIVGVKRGLDKILLTTHHPNIRVETAGIGRKKFLRFVQLKQKELKRLEKASAKTPKKK